MTYEKKSENPMSDELLREVDEELKEENFKKLIKKYAPIVTAIVLIALVCVGGYEFFKYRNRQRALRDDAFLTAALTLAEEGKIDESLAALQGMRQNASEGYAVLAALHQTTLLLQQGDVDAALRVLDSLVNNAKLPAPVRNLARFNKVSLAVDLPNADYAALEEELMPLTQKEAEAWAPQAYELRAVIALKQADVGKAKDSLYSLLALDGLSEDVRLRASENLALIEKEFDKQENPIVETPESAETEEKAK